MPRGAAPFDHRVLAGLRRTRTVDGNLLSAAELARRLGTSKARVLAYEAGTSVPEAARIAELARIFRVPARELYQEPARPEDSIRTLRLGAGLTMAELAARLGISVAAYRDLERAARLPARTDGTLPLRLARELSVQVREIDEALDRHPHASERRQKITQLLEELFARAHTTHTAAVIDMEDPQLLGVAHLLRRPPSVVCRLVNRELALLRQSLRVGAEARASLAYAQGEREAQRARHLITVQTQAVEEAPERAATTLVRFLAEAMSSRQWRALVHLVNRESPVPEPRARELADPEAWDGLVARNFVTRERVSGNGPLVYALSSWGLGRVMAQAPLYACLYPRAPAPDEQLALRHRLRPWARRSLTVRPELGAAPADA
ncbi:helix-turn-helix transcriptional regulator [Streptomyces sp. cg2]|uniref:helix-turn-helix transcriptional regulator n=1 Tax=Streptomyces sp. cg2 TaxID=3238799 RepID=UPI0034E24198